ncbi:MAG: tetratricopeptide repeat protein [Thermoguttaceae bacterium]
MDGAKCMQPGCGGTIDSGFCNRCGLEPTGAGPAADDGHTVAGGGTAGLIGGTGSAAIGSSRSASLSSSARLGAGSTRHTTGSARSSSRKHLGLGLVAVPELPPLDPEKVIMANPQVPPNRRFCANPDCHDAQGNPTPLTRREAGFCPACGKPYSFVPSLKPGDVVADQYEVKGCLAFGGLGWIYLAKDTVLNRWVVLKGLLNTRDEAAAAAAVAERQFLAAVKHPNIVGIYNFVARGTEGFIVMEFVNGTSLKTLRKERGPLPPDEAIAYVHRILAAFAYLHAEGMVYCDMKPDNFMLEGAPPDVKLIDMGGVRRLDDPGGDIYGTHGYSAPEAGEGPTVASDLYTIGRTLAVLLMEFRFQSAYEFDLPPPVEQEVLARHDSLYRFLLKATQRDPNLRFQSADEMADQLAGVLHEVAAGKNPPKPVESMHFQGDVLAMHEELDSPSSKLLSDLKVRADDPGTAYLFSIAGAPDFRGRAAMLNEGIRKVPDSRELQLRLARTMIEMESYAEAAEVLDRAEKEDPFDWRVAWYRGYSLLAQGEVAAYTAFDQVYNELPGEPAVKLAVAMAAEAAGDDATAARLYDLVSTTDPSFVTATFGLARCLTRGGKRAEAVAAYERVPASSSLHPRAQIGLARVLIDLHGGGASVEELCRASVAIDAMAAEGRDVVQLRAELFESALRLLTGQRIQHQAAVRLLGRSLDEASLRRGLEESLRFLARLEPDRRQQIVFVDRANQIRPVTWI